MPNRHAPRHPWRDSRRGHTSTQPRQTNTETDYTGGHAISDSSRKRLDAITATSGALTDAFSPGYLDELREDWPEY